MSNLKIWSIAWPLPIISLVSNEAKQKLSVNLFKTQISKVIQTSQSEYLWIQLGHLWGYYCLPIALGWGLCLRTTD